MKNIVYIHPHFTSSGGAGKFVLETAKLLAADGNYRIFIVSGKQDENIIKEYRTSNVFFKQIKMPLTSSFTFWLFYPLWLIKVIKNINSIKKEYNGNITIFAHVFPANRWGSFYKMMNNNDKLLFMCHEPSAFIHSNKWINAINSRSKRLIAKIINPIFKLIDVYLIKKSDTILVNSEFTKEETIRIYGRADDIIYPGYDQTKFTPNFSIKKKDYIGVISRLTKFKNIDFIINVFQEFCKKNCDIILKIGGEGEDKSNLESKVRKMGLENRIQFLGKLSDNDIVLFYQEARCILFASEKEPFGIVPIEAMASGTIVIGHNSGGLKETIPEKFRYNNKEEALALLNKVITENKYETFKGIDNFTWTNNVLKLKQYF